MEDTLKYFKNGFKTWREFMHYPDHVFNEDGQCWCEPELEYEDPETGARVWVHREVQ